VFIFFIFEKVDLDWTMNKYLLLLIFFLASACRLNAQNLVPNGSFEILTKRCPKRFTTIREGILKSWFSPNNSSPDFFNICALDEFSSVPENIFIDSLYPKSGNGYAGLVLYNGHMPKHREYISVQLIEPMLQDSIYSISFFVSPSNRYISTVAYSSNAIGLVFSQEKLYAKPLMQIKRKPSLEVPPAFFMKKSGIWYEINTTYKALGGEMYLTIGSFRKEKDMQMQILDGQKVTKLNYLPFVYIFIDDIQVSLGAK